MELLIKKRTQSDKQVLTNRDLLTKIYVVNGSYTFFLTASFGLVFFLNVFAQSNFSMCL